MPLRKSALVLRPRGRTRARPPHRLAARRIGSRPVACEERDQDGYGRMVAVCRVGGEDLNAWMAAEAWTFTYCRYGNVAINYWRAGQGALSNEGRLAERWCV